MPPSAMSTRLRLSCSYGFSVVFTFYCRSRTCSFCLYVCFCPTNVLQCFMLASFSFLFLLETDSSSTNTTENPSPSLSPPPSATKASPLHSSASMNGGSGGGIGNNGGSYHHLNTSNESDDDGQDCMDDDADDDNPDRPSDGNGSPGLNGSMQSKRKKKTRTVFSRAQVFQLESTFDCKR